jgi:hypothetical protein
MGKLSALKPSKYLKADEVPRPIRLIMREIVTETIEGEGESKEVPVLYFEKANKGLVINATNLSTLVDTFGDDTEIIVGKPIVLYVDKNVQYRGKKVKGLRLRPAADSNPAEPVDEEPLPPDDDPLAGAVDDPGYDDVPI